MPIRTRLFRNEQRFRGRLLVTERPGVYHVLSRTTQQRMLLDATGKEVFRKLLHKQAAFAGVEVLAYCLMGNHFHLLLRVPVKHRLSDRELLRRYAAYYGEDALPQSSFSVAELRAILDAGGAEAEAAREQIHARLHDLPAFMRELKQRFTLWYNHTHNTRGTIWAARYKSLLVEDERASLTVVAAYIDLNPVRANLVTDPADYRWCGYAEALAGRHTARNGICALLGETPKHFADALAAYRLVLFGKGHMPKKGGADPHGRISAAELEKVLASGGKVRPETLLRLRVRYFTDGLILGSGRFLREIHRNNPTAFGPRRVRTGGVAMPGFAEDGLRVMRDLRRGVFG